MSEYVVTKTGNLPTGQIRVWQTTDTGESGTTTFHPDAITSRMAEYGLANPREALDVILHEPHATAWFQPLDDTAAAAGWVTSTGPDADPVYLYNAASTAEARAAHRCRLDASPVTVVDTYGLLDQLAAAHPVDMTLYRRCQENVDTTRWHLIYGGLPETPRGDDHA